MLYYSQSISFSKEPKKEKNISYTYIILSLREICNKVATRKATISFYTYLIIIPRETHNKVGTLKIKISFYTYLTTPFSLYISLCVKMSENGI